MGPFMTVASSTSNPNATSGHGNAALDCNTVHMRAQCRHLATVVTISGRIDATNVGPVSQYARRFVLAEKPFVLDLSGVDSFAAKCISMLRIVDEQCRSAAVEWALVASPAVTHLLHIGDDAAIFPTAASVAEALHEFADDILTRRRGLLPLLATPSSPFPPVTAATHEGSRSACDSIEGTAFPAGLRGTAHRALARTPA
jgi:anti-anti-sigma factor